MANRLFLIDGMAIIYRAYFAFIKNPRITSSGEDVSAIFGFINSLFDIQKKYNPTHIAVAFDRSEPTFRHEMFLDYKANREETPEAIRFSIPIIKEFLQAMSIPIIEKAGFEADDIIGTLSRRAQKDGFETYMFTPDKDYAQLVDSNTYILKPGRGGSEHELIDSQSILDNWNIKQIKQVIDILGLAGDTSDNIPGVPGIGPKTAQKLISDYGSVEEVLKNIDKLKGKQKENLEAYREQAILSKKLVTINCDVPIEISPADLVLSEVNHDLLKKLMVKFEFRTMLKRFYDQKEESKISEELFLDENLHELSNSSYQTIKDKQVTYKCVDNLSELEALSSTLAKSDLISVDLETTSLNVKEACIVGIALSIKENEGWFISIPENTKNICEYLKDLIPIFENENITKLGQNIKYDISVLRWNGIKIKGPIIDTMIAHYLIDPDQRHNLDAMSEAILNYKPIHISSLIGNKKNEQISMREVNLKDLTNYATEDADITLQIWNKLKYMLEEKNLGKVFYEIEMPLLPVLTEMEYRGINIDRSILREQSNEAGEIIVKLENLIYTKAGMPFNINSPKQLGEVLFDLLRIVEKPKKTKTGQYQTGEDVLAELKSQHKIVEEILRYRQLAKLKNTYLDALPNEISKKTSRIHTTFSQAVTTTGRLSSQNPNIQNIPIRTSEGRQIRRAFIPQNGYQLLACDYSQIELRIMAELSGDDKLKEGFFNNDDIHTITASNVFKIDIADVSREMRSKAKMVNFGILYGISAFGLSKRLDIPKSEASEIITQYQNAYPDVQNYLERTILFAQKNGYVETITGRRRYIRDINAKNKLVSSGAERNAINAPIQGTAADMIKIAMIRIENLLNKYKSDTKMLIQVHDELVFDLAPKEQDLIPQIESIMREAIPMEVPIIIESGIGNNWLEAH